MANNEDLFKKIIAHAKEYGFVFQSSEIYDGLSAVYDYAQNGVELKNNIKEYKLEEKNSRFIFDIINGVFDNFKEIDSKIKKLAPEWPIEQVTIIDRNILRIGSGY